jgi:SAM-dependent methyltransferase
MRAFAPLPIQERWFVHGRLLTAPLAEMVQRIPPGRILDLGCGHGGVTALLAVDRPDRFVLGIDPDPRKVEWARASVGRLPNVEVLAGTGDTLLPEHESSFDAVVVADVLYLLPLDRWADFLATTYRLLKPGGALMIKESEGDRSWRHLKCVLQEMLMVHVFRRTRGSGGLQLAPRSFAEGALRRVGFEGVHSTKMSAGYTTPHLLIEARRPG